MSNNEPQIDSGAGPRLAGARAMMELVRPLGLNPQRLDFVINYHLNGNNGHKAALAAGYSAKSAQTQSYQLLQNPKIRAALAAIAEAQGIRLDVLHARLLEVALDADVRDFEQWLLGEESLADVYGRGVNTKLIKSVMMDTKTRVTKNTKTHEITTITTVRRQVSLHDPLKAIALLMAGLRGADEGEGLQRPAEIDATLGEGMTREFLEELGKPLVPGIPRQKSLPSPPET